MTLKQQKNPNSSLLLRLWRHEMTRVFYDRLCENKDREWFQSQLRDVIEDNFPRVTANDVEEVFFGDYSRGRALQSDYAEHQPLHLRNLLKVSSLLF
jgi:hypothetical protein